MGKILTQLTITNRGDQVLAARGVIPAATVRSVTLDDALGDTGATTLCLPADIIAQLGLELLREVDVSTAHGVSGTSNSASSPTPPAIPITPSFDEA
jgi:hypothetical protein